MKTLCNKFFCFAMICLTGMLVLLSGVRLMAGDVKVPGGGSTEFSILQSDYSLLRFTSSVGEFSYVDVNTREGVFTQVTIAGYGYSTVEGDPKIPVLRRLIGIPAGAEATVRILSVSYSELDLSSADIQNLIIPAQPPVSKNIEDPYDLDFVVNWETYGMDKFLGQDPVTVNILGSMRGFRLARLEVSPFQYNPVQKVLRIITHLEAMVEYTGADIQATEAARKKYFSPWFEGIYSFVANYQPVTTDSLIMDEPVTYVIVSDPMFQAALQPFIQWKTKKGFRIIEAYTNDPNVGTTTTSIKTYLKNLFLSPPSGYHPHSFVLFVGDVAQIPTFNGTAGSHVTDLYYCEYTNDLYPECFYGRFSATNLTQLQPQIDKTLEYEQYLMPDPAFLGEVVMVSGADASHAQTWGNGQINYGTTYYFNAAHGLYSHTYLQPEPSGGNYSQLIRQNVSDGVAYANYTAHCSTNGWADPSFTISHISALTNAHKYPLMVGNCCSSLEFQTTCFGEEILRAADKGALGYIGGSNSTYWDEDFWWGVGFEAISANPTYNPSHLGAYDRTFHDHGEPLAEWYVTQGQMVSAGNLAVTQSGSSRETYYWEIYHLMGDPSVMIYFSVPPSISASYDPLMPLASTSFVVNTDPYSYVAISKDGVLHGVAVADATGVADVQLDPITVPGTADVVITRQNGEPFFGTVVVASPTGPYVLLENFQIDDAAGNANGLADYSESILLDVTLKNMGSTTGTNLTATLMSMDPYITITDPVQSWPDIPPQATSSQAGAFGLSVASNAPDEHIALFTIEVTDGNETWSSNLSFALHAPLLGTSGYPQVDDAAGGNGNGLLDPGETAGVTITVANNGHSLSPNATAGLTTSSPYITVNSGTAVPGAIPAGSTAPAVFNITVDPATPVGTVVDLTIDVVAGAYGFIETFMLTVGLVIEDWESGGFASYPWQFGGNAPWEITSSAPWEGVYCAKSGPAGNYQSSELFIVLETVASDSISFYRKVSSEATYDFLQFYIDGTLKEEWSGEMGWAREAYFVPAGLHTFRWVYDKDVSMTGGSDCGWVDYIVFPPLAAIEPDIAVSPVFIDFGDVVIGTNSTETFTISNNGSDNLTGTITAPQGYSVSDVTEGSLFKEQGKNVITFLVGPGNSLDIYVTFEPTQPLCFSDNVEIASNDPDTPLSYVAVTGCGRLGPDILPAPASFDKMLPPAGTCQDMLSIANNGDMTLDFTAQVVYNAESRNVATVYPSAQPYWSGTTNGSSKTQNSLVIGWNSEDGWFKFDVSSIPVGSTINSIEFYGYVYETYYPYWSATSLPMDPVTATASELKDWIQAHNSQSLAYVYRNESSSFATGWHNYTLNAQANADLETALAQGWFGMGMDSRDNSSSYYIKFEGWNETNKPYLVVDYTYNPPYTWLTLDGGNMVSNSVGPGVTHDITVGFDAGTLPLGTYTADILINSNDPDAPLMVVPATLTIGQGYDVSLKVILEGPCNNGQMNTILCGMPDFPMVQPYSGAPWYYTGTETIQGTPAPDVVDWVLVELRDADAAANANQSTQIAIQAGLLLSDGSITGTDAVSPLMFAASFSQNLFAVVWHRNHLGVLSNNPLILNGGVFTYDFSTGEGQAYGGSLGHKQVEPGLWGMMGGDGDCDGQIGNGDKIDVWVQQSGQSGYLYGDFNLDGQVNNGDKVEVWGPNSGNGCQVP
ncbi:MAG: choice-of-anchor D domain-containing protein [Bacteroidales bacterium]|nr:choice-of-anchor D domain-containing protein [Bacteroidales bacterium]